MKTVALLLSALNIKTFLCQHLDCEYFKNEDSNLVLCSCQVKHSEVDSENTTENVSVIVFSLFTSEQFTDATKFSLLLTQPEYVFHFLL